MSSKPKFELKLTDEDRDTAILSSIFCMSPKRLEILTEVIEKEMGRHSKQDGDGDITKTLTEVVAKCETLEEIVWCSFQIGAQIGHFEAMEQTYGALDGFLGGNGKS